jgi:hypothetical protein
VSYNIYEIPSQGTFVSTIQAAYDAYVNNAVNTVSGQQRYLVRGSAINNPPTKPTLTAPVSNITIDHFYTITWNASTDSDGDTIRYSVDLSTNNGSTYTTLISNLNALSYTYDFTNVAETTQAKLRIRAYDGTEYSSYEYSPTFTVAHKPSVPSFTKPSSSAEIDGIYNITWNQSSDPGGDSIKYQIELSTNNGSTYSTILTNVTGGSTNYDFSNAAETKQAKLRIKALDNYGNSSDWAYSPTFTISHGKAYVKINGVYTKVPVYVKLNGVYTKVSVYEKRSGTYVKI